MSSDHTLPANRLGNETSSYLRRHAYQPVDWYPWGEEALENAAEDDKPILLSIGYASNHWCSRMERESFEDERVAAFMNARFVCVKVDREERPDIDSHYMEALEAITGEAGYPVTLFLTPEGKPFYGGSYYPPEAGDGLPAFGSVLNEVAVLWQKKREETVRKSKEIEQDIGRRLDEVPEPEPLSPALLQQAVFTVQSAFDEEHGGFGEPPKFPQSSVLEFMLSASSRGVARATKVAELTLRKMALGGIYDQIGGGFHRFAVDRAWQVPHFEKMLYDNAQLARVYTHAWQLFHNPLYRRVALDTLEYLLRDMADPEGAFYSSESSDSGGKQGGFYTWSYDEFEAVAPQAIEYYGVTRSGNFEGRNVLSAASDDPPGQARAALLKQRVERRKPVRDEKILSSWNGLVIGALAEAGATFDRIDLVEAARRTAGFLLLRYRDPSTARLYHSYRDDEHQVLGMLEDYAYLAEGLFTLWEVTFEPEWIDACDRLCRQMLEEFWDSEEGGLFTTATDVKQLIPRRKDYLDPATPSAAAVASIVLQKLAVLAGDEELARRGREILDQAQPNIQGLFLDACAMVSAIELNLASLTEIAIIGRGGDSRTRALRQQLWDRFLPNKVCAGSPPGIASPLLKGKTLVNDAPAAYVAQGDLVKPPVTDPQEFANLVKFWTPPSAAQVDKVTGLISNALQRRHFFDNLKNPAWIQPLKEAGLFETPPDPIYDYAEETVGSPPWPQSRYLARMAQFSPKEVQQVSLEVPDADNVQVHEDLADVALAVPADLAGSFVAKAKQWLQSPYQLHLPEKLGKLVRRLAEGGRIDEALELTAALLEVRAEQNPQAPHAFRLAPEPRAKFRKYDYEQILEKDFPALVTAAPLRALETVCGLLESAIEESFGPGEGQAPIDYSYLWRPAIHPADQNADKTLRDSLVAVLVETAEQIAREQSFLVPQMVELLERRGRHIFTRTALHLLRVWPETAPEMILSRLMDRRIFEDPHFHHEYLLLARDHFEELTAEHQALIFRWIAEGPDLQLWLHDPDSPLPDDKSAESAERYRQRWQLKRLSVLEEYLPDAEKATYQRLAEAHGVDEHADFVIHHAGSRPDPTTPIQAEELHFDRFEEVLEFLSSWKPTPGLGNPTIEGLALKLAQVVATEPAKFGRSARRFKGLDPLYIWAVLQGLREGSEAFTFDWAPVLDLCAWVVAQPIDEMQRWHPARLEVARILSRGFTQGNAQMPFELRTAAWEVLKPLTDDPDPVGGTPPDSPPQTVSGQVFPGDASQQSVSTDPDPVGVGTPPDSPPQTVSGQVFPGDASQQSVSTDPDPVGVGTPPDSPPQTVSGQVFPGDASQQSVSTDPDPVGVGTPPDSPPQTVSGQVFPGDASQQSVSTDPDPVGVGTPPDSPPQTVSGQVFPGDASQQSVSTDPDPVGVGTPPDSPPQTVSGQVFPGDASQQSVSTDPDPVGVGTPPDSPPQTVSGQVFPGDASQQSVSTDPDPVGVGTPPDSPPQTVSGQAFPGDASQQSVSTDPDPVGVGTPPDSPPQTVSGQAFPGDASQQSVSTVRGEAMHAVIRYALWLRRHLESSPGARNRLREGFGLMPEVREVLEHHLDPAVDPSPAIRAVYGRWFAWLLMLDGPWAKEQVAGVFPREETLEPLRDAAWEALISFSPAYDHLLGIIGPEYERGVELITRFEQRAEHKVHPENRLAEHLMVFYLRGGLALDDKGLLARFFRDASETLRRHALGFIGRTLNAQQGKIPRDFELRLMHLWERRLKSAESVASAGHLEELAAFGWWFASGKLEDAWSLRQLGKILELGVKIEAATQVIARLKDLAEKHPERSVQCLSLILRGEQDSVSLVAWTEDSRSIINKAMQSGDSAARTMAIELLSFFDVQELEELVRWD